MADTKETTDVREHRGVEIRLRPAPYGSSWTATWQFDSEPGIRNVSGSGKEGALEKACEVIDDFYIESTKDVPYLEIENVVTGAILRVPGQFFHAEEAFEMAEAGPAAEASWEEWTEPIEITLKELKEEYTSKPHFAYGAFEMLAQDNPWGAAIKDVKKKERFGSSVHSSNIIIRTGRE